MATQKRFVIHTITGSTFEGGWSSEDISGVEEFFSYEGLQAVDKLYLLAEDGTAIYFMPQHVVAVEIQSRPEA